jgi:hypothetical protein
LRHKHLRTCLELALEISKQNIAATSTKELAINVKQPGGTLEFVFSGPSIPLPQDRADQEIQYSLFNRARGNSALSGFLLLRLRNLLEMVGGSFAVDTGTAKTMLRLGYPLS